MTAPACFRALLQASGAVVQSRVDRLWAPPAGVTQAYGLFDVIFGSAFVEPAFSTVSYARVNDIVERGGTVVYRFHTDRVRAILPLSVAQALPHYLIGVTNANDFTIGLFMRFARPDDRSAFTSRGGVFVPLGARRGALAYHILVSDDQEGRISDGMLPWLRTDARISLLEPADGPWRCPTNNPATLPARTP